MHANLVRPAGFQRTLDEGRVGEGFEDADVGDRRLAAPVSGTIAILMRCDGWRPIGSLTVPSCFIAPAARARY
jgi:hypothetical protein